MNEETKVKIIKSAIRRAEKSCRENGDRLEYRTGWIYIVIDCLPGWTKITDLIPPDDENYISEAIGEFGDFYSLEYASKLKREIGNIWRSK